jgi:hypothetical protein
VILQEETTLAVTADTLALPRVAAPTPDETELPSRTPNRLARDIIHLHEIIHRLYERERLVDSSDENGALFRN